MFLLLLPSLLRLTQHIVREVSLGVVLVLFPSRSPRKVFDSAGGYISSFSYLVSCGISFLWVLNAI